MSDNRKVGKNFDEDMAKDIFGKLRNVKGKTKPKKESKFKNISYMINEAQYLENKGLFDEAIDLYKQVLYTLPDSSKTYDSLIAIYQKQGNVNAEIDILKKAIMNCKKNTEYKKRLKKWRPRCGRHLDCACQGHYSALGASSTGASAGVSSTLGASAFLARLRRVDFFSSFLAVRAASLKSTSSISAMSAPSP